MTTSGASTRDALIQSAVTLLATGRAKSTTQAVRMAQELVLEIDRLLTRGPTRSAALRKATREPGESGARRAAAPRAGGKGGKGPAARRAGGPGAPLLGVRARRVLERLGLVRPDEADLAPRQLAGKVCAAHLDGAKACGPATIKQIAAWFEAHGEALPGQCAAFDANWLTNRCDEEPAR